MACQRPSKSQRLHSSLHSSGRPAQGLRWSSQPVDGHQFPRLRLKFRPNLVSLAGGMTGLPVTDPEVRCWRAEPV